MLADTIMAYHQGCSKAPAVNTKNQQIENSVIFRDFIVRWSSICYLKQSYFHGSRFIFLVAQNDII